MLLSKIILPFASLLCSLNFVSIFFALGVYHLVVLDMDLKPLVCHVQYCKHRIFYFMRSVIHYPKLNLVQMIHRPRYLNNCNIKNINTFSANSFLGTKITKVLFLEDKSLYEKEGRRE